MNEQREKLSALIDDYQHTDSDQTLLNDALGDVNQQYAMRRYQMIGEVMRNEMPEAIKLDFAADVMSKIEQESALHVKQEAVKETPQQSSWFWSVLFKPVAGLAVAATVAFVAVSSLQLQPVSVDQADSLASVDDSSAKVEILASIPVINRGLSTVSVNSKSSSSPVGMNWKIKRSGPDIQKKLNTYLVNHNEFSNSLQGIIPQVRVVGFDAQK
jgi:negative regulator of sigma E activity